MVINRIALTCIAFVSLCATGNAHPGHGSSYGENTLLHYATSPVHMVPVVFAAIFLLGLSWMFLRGAKVGNFARRS